MTITHDHAHQWLDEVIREDDTGRRAAHKDSDQLSLRQLGQGLLFLKSLPTENGEGNIVTHLRNLARTATMVGPRDFLSLRACHVRAVLNQTHWPMRNGAKKANTASAQDSIAQTLLGLIEYHLRRAGVANPERSALKRATPEGIRRERSPAKRMRKKPLLPQHQKSVLAALNHLPWSDFRAPMYALYFVEMFRDGERNTVFGRLEWADAIRTEIALPDDRSGLRVVGFRADGRGDKDANDVYLSERGIALAHALEDLLPVERPRLVMFDEFEYAQTGRVIPMQSSTRKSLYAIVGKLAGIPTNVAFSPNGIRHLARTSDIVAQRPTHEIRRRAAHADQSHLAGETYFDALTEDQAAEAVRNVMGAANGQYCRRCRIPLLPYDLECPRRNCGYVVSARRTAALGTTLDAFNDQAEAARSEG